MSTLLIKDADLVVTMNDEREEIASCDVLVRDNAIAEVGSNLEAEADETIDARGCIVSTRAHQLPQPHVGDALSRLARAPGRAWRRLVRGARAHMA